MIGSAGNGQSADAIHGDDEGTEHVVDWVSQRKVDLTRWIAKIAAEYGVNADPASVGVIELGRDPGSS